MPRESKSSTRGVSISTCTIEDGAPFGPNEAQEMGGHRTKSDVHARTIEFVGQLVWTGSGLENCHGSLVPEIDQQWLTRVWLI